jgi:hypothetical protein
MRCPMRYIIIFLSFLYATSVYSSEEPVALRKLVTQQKSWHTPGASEYTGALLDDWKWGLQDCKVKPRRTYLLWVDNPAKQCWLRSFLTVLKQDLQALGVQLLERGVIGIQKSELDKHMKVLESADRIILIITDAASIFVEGTYPGHSRNDWDYIRLRLEGSLYDYMCSDATLKYEPGAILPLHVSGSEAILNRVVKDHESMVLPVENLSSMNYADLLIRISRFVSDVPATEDFHRESLKVMGGAKTLLEEIPHLKIALGL